MVRAMCPLNSNVFFFLLLRVSCRGQIDVSGGQLRVNERAIIVAGANRHEHDDRGGKVVPLESMVRDAVMMKRYNFNAVRTSHYPNHPFFYEASKATRSEAKRREATRSEARQS